MTTGRDRKNSIKALFGGDILPGGTERAPETKSAGGDTHRAASGAVRAMGLTLSSITREAEEARVLRQALEEGERIVSLDPARIDVSFVSDRLSDEERDDPDFLTLVESMREAGQQVPILVRPFPAKDAEGERAAGEQARYQVAYGHRRLKAARRLGIEVKAIVRPLSDEELVLAQGKENAERRNLSFIERALFAQVLVVRGFERKLIADALAVQKSELSRLLQVAETVPIRFVRAIGPAPKAGRDRWMALAAIFANGNGAEIEKADDEVTSRRFLAAGSDERFQMLFNRLTRLPQRPETETQEIRRPDGAVLAMLEMKGKTVRIAFEPDVDPAFIARLKDRMAEDYAVFLAEKAGNS